MIGRRHRRKGGGDGDHRAACQLGRQAEPLVSAVLVSQSVFSLARDEVTIWRCFAAHIRRRLRVSARPDGCATRSVNSVRPFGAQKGCNNRWISASCLATRGGAGTYVSCYVAGSVSQVRAVLRMNAANDLRSGTSSLVQAW